MSKKPIYGYPQPGTSQKINSSKDFPKVEAAFYASLVPISPELEEMKDERDRIAKNFQEVVIIKGDKSKTLFLIGILVFEKILFLGKNKSINETNFIEQSFDNVKGLASTKRGDMIILNDMKTAFKTLCTEYRKRETMIKSMGEENIRKPWIRLLTDSLERDQESVACLIQVARCVLINYLNHNRELKTKYRSIYDKLVRDFWIFDSGSYEEEFKLYSFIAEVFRLRITIFFIYKGEFEQNTICPEEKDEVFIFEYYKRIDKHFKALLYPKKLRVSEKLIDNPDSKLHSGIEASKQASEERKKEKDSYMNSTMTSSTSKYNSSNGSVSSTMYTSTTYRNSMSQQPKEDEPKLQDCSICGSPISADLLYRNKSCGHYYCLYCLQEIQEKQFSRLNLCILKNCNGELNTLNLVQFFREKSQQEKESSPVKPSSISNLKPEEEPPKNQPHPTHIKQESNQMLSSQNPSFQKSVIEESKVMERPTKECSLCRNPFTEENLYAPRECSHRLCHDCLSKNHFGSTSRCSIPTCGRLFDNKSVVNFLNRTRSSTNEDPNKGKCDYCKKEYDRDKIFKNTKCKHKYCLDCTEKVQFRKGYCPASGCMSVIDARALNDYKIKFLEAQLQDSTEKRIVECKTCGDKLEIPITNGANPEYWKCLKCNMFYCGKHVDVMNSCLCMCPFCLSSLHCVEALSRKSCKRCSKHFCMICQKVFDKMGKPTCKCGVLVNVKNQIVEVNGRKTLGTTAWCDSCDDASDQPFLKMSCQHNVCEVCILARMVKHDMKEMKCPICFPYK